MGFLTKEEKGILALVSTTVKQAEQILERNMGLLNAMTQLKRANKDPASFISNIGCPHCSIGYHCQDCDWRIIRNKTVDKKGRTPTTFFCCYVPFGGVNYLKAFNFRYARLQYSDRDESFYYLGARTTLQKKEREGQYQKCVRFFKGHIEWAMSVIALG